MADTAILEIPTLDSLTTNAGVASFNVLNISVSYKRSVEHSIRHVPGGNLSVLHVSGRKEAERTFELYVANVGELTNLDKALGLTGKLRYAGLDPTVYDPNEGIVAVLLDFDAKEWIDSEGKQTVKATFVTDTATD